MSDDPLKNIVLRITIALISAIIIISFFKPVVAIAAELMVCNSCDASSSVLFVTVTFMGAVGIAVYKLLGAFYG